MTSALDYFATTTCKSQQAIKLFRQWTDQVGDYHLPELN